MLNTLEFHVQQSRSTTPRFWHHNWTQQPERKFEHLAISFPAFTLQRRASDATLRHIQKRNFEHPDIAFPTLKV